jgi:hypothetical protein
MEGDWEEYADSPYDFGVLEGDFLGFSKLEVLLLKAEDTY